jgi:hypothetical protein
MNPLVDRVAAEVRAEMARQRMTIGDLARALGVTYKPARDRYYGHIAFSINELADAAEWLGVEVEAFMSPARAEQVAA